MGSTPSAGGAPEGAQLFPELVRAHFRRFVSEAGYGRPWGVPKAFAPAASRHDWPWRRAGLVHSERDTVERELPALLSEDRLRHEFQAAAGNIICIHWCTSSPSAVALTAKTAGRKPWSRDPEYHIHRATDWVTPENASVTELLHHCDTLAIKVGAILPGTPRRLAMLWLFAMESYLLGLIEQRHKLTVSSRGNTRPDELSAAGATGHRIGLRRTPTDSLLLTRAKHEVLLIERYYDRAANKAARLTYCGGMVLGLILTAFIAAGVAWLVHQTFGSVNTHSDSTKLFFASYVGGSVGAFISVLTRMKRDDFRLDYEVGRAQSVMLGCFRPFIGASFGLAVYYAVKGGVLQVPTPGKGDTTYFVTLLAFAAGFSERWTQIIIGPARRTVEAALSGENPSQAVEESTDAAR